MFLAPRPDPGRARFPSPAPVRLKVAAASLAGCRRASLSPWQREWRQTAEAGVSSSCGHMEGWLRPKSDWEVLFAVANGVLWSWNKEGKRDPADALWVNHRASLCQMPLCPFVYTRGFTRLTRIRSQVSPLRLSGEKNCHIRDPNPLPPAHEAVP